MKKILTLLLIALAIGAVTAFAAEEPTATAASGVLGTIDDSIGKTVATVVGKLQSVAILWLSSFIMLQFVITNYGLLKSGADIEAVFAKFVGSFLWFAVCWYLVLNGSEFVDKVGKSFFSTASGLGISYSPGDLLDKGVSVGANMITAVQKAAGITDFGSVIITGICGVFILLVMALIALKVFLMKTELALVVMISPISFAFLGLDALKDQGIAPFKSLISLLYRILILGVLIECADYVTSDAAASITSIYDNAAWYTKITGIGNGIWPALFNVTMSYLIIGFLAFKSDSIAASLASGSTNLGTSDLATAAAMGAAVGGAIGSAGATLGMGKGPQLMSDFMKQAFGGGSVGMSNATSDTGTGGVGTPPSKTSDAANMSKTASGEAGGLASTGNGESDDGQPASRGTGTDDTTPTSGGTPSTDGANAGATGFGGVPNRLPEDIAAESRKAERDAAREQRRQAKQGSAAATAGIEGASGAAPAKQTKSLIDRVNDVNEHFAREKASVHVSVNPHHN